MDSVSYMGYWMFSICGCWWRIFQTSISIIRCPSRNCTGLSNFLLYLLTEYLPHFAYLLMIVSYIETSNPIQTPQDSILLQKDLDLLSHWASIWQMKFNATKCVVLRCSRSPTLIQHDTHVVDTLPACVRIDESVLVTDMLKIKKM